MAGRGPAAHMGDVAWVVFSGRHDVSILTTGGGELGWFLGSQPGSKNSMMSIRGRNIAQPAALLCDSTAQPCLGINRNSCSASRGAPTYGCGLRACEVDSGSK